MDWLGIISFSHDSCVCSWLKLPRTRFLMSRIALWKSIDLYGLASSGSLSKTLDRKCIEMLNYLKWKISPKKSPQVDCCSTEWWGLNVLASQNLEISPILPRIAFLLFSIDCWSCYWSSLAGPCSMQSNKKSSNSKSPGAETVVQVIVICWSPLNQSLFMFNFQIFII